MEDWIPMVGALGLTAIIIVPFIVSKVIKYKLEIAKINAETTLKAEQIRANNQLEIEMLMKQQQSQSGRIRYQEEDSYEEAQDRIKRRA